MPKPSFSQKLGKKPSRSYLSGLNDAGGGDDGGSVLSFRSGDSNYSNRNSLVGSMAGDGAGARGRYNSMPSPPPKQAIRGYAASDVGVGKSYAPTSRLRTLSSSLGGGNDSGSGDRFASYGVANNRRSVTFGDLNPALFNDRDRLEVMSDIGGYGRNGDGGTGRRRAPSLTSSIDAGSEAGSTLSATRRASVRRGSKSEKVTRTSQSMDLWHNNLGGPGLVRKSESSGTVTSTSNPLSSIVQRKGSTSGSGSGFGSPTKKGFMDRDPQPSRRYSMQPPYADGNTAASTTAATLGPAAGIASSNDRLEPPRDGRSSPTSSASSETSFALRTKVHSRHSQKQRAKSGLDPVAQQAQSSGSSKAQSAVNGINGSSRPEDLQRSSSVSSTGSKKSTRSSASTSSSAAKGLSSSTGSKGQPLSLHSTTLKNNLMNMPSGPPSPSKRKRTPEQVVEALAKAGLLDRVMEVVQEADEEELGTSGGEDASQSASRRLSAALQPIGSQTSQAVQPPAPVANQQDQQRGSELNSATQAEALPMATASAPEPEPTREELVQTPASEFATPPSTPPDTPTASEVPEGSLWGTTNGAETPKPVQPVQGARAPMPSSQNGPVSAHTAQLPTSTNGPQIQKDDIIAAGSIPRPVASNGPPLRLESLAAMSNFNPHLVSRSLTGTILVLSFHNLATVFARLTWNNWANYEEVAATGDPSTADSSGEYHRYHFTWSLPPGTNGADVQLALRLEDGSTNQAHWDNNGGQNYNAKLAPLQKRSPSIQQHSTPPSSGQATPVMQQKEGSAPLPNGAPPRVFLVRTVSDDQNEPSILYDPNRRSLVMDGQSTDFVAQTGSSGSLPFPAGAMLQHQNVETASTGSSYSVPTPNGSIKGGRIGAEGAGAKPNVQDTTSVSDRGAATTSLPPSRAHSVSSHASGDSTNAPFHYPTRAGAYQASALQQQSTLNRRPSRDMQPTPDMPNIMTALGARGNPDDLSGLYTSSGHDSGNNSVANGSVPARQSPSEATSIGARSATGMSVMSLPTTSRINTKAEVKPFSMSALTSGNIILPTSNSTMRALTLTSNAAQTLGRSFWRNNTSKSLRQNPKVPDHLNGALASSATMTYSNLTPVPHKVRSDECLVQVFACAIDFWDRAKVEILHTRGQGYGFVPGRAFVGKVLETGNDVDVTKVKRGDFVYGLADLRKSGALAEYVTVQRGMLSQAPNGALSLEQIAAVALSGIAAFQAMDELCTTLPRGSKLIILNAHEGVGAMALQLGLSLRPAGDLWMVGHYPSDFADGDSILRQLGASETLCGDPVVALQSLRESTYDAILDSIGGRKIYDAAKRILHDDGYFVTTVGDALSVPTPRASWRKSLKALFKARDKKNIMYWFPSIESDARAALGRLREISEAGQIKPVVKRVYKFEDGPKAFQGPSEQAVIMLLDQEKLANGTGSS